MPRFFSQYGEDRWLAPRLPQRGVFVEVGAGNGVRNSNTYYFELSGWEGLCIDADPRNVKAMLGRRKRPIQAAVGMLEGERKLHLCLHNTELSSLIRTRYHLWGGTASVQGMKLQTILLQENIRHIDLLSVDTEGTELEVVASFDHHFHRTRFIVIEYSTSGLPSNEERVRAFFAHLPYELRHRTPANLIYERV